MTATEVGIKATGTGSTGALIEIKNAKDNESIGVLAELKSNTNTVLISGGIGKLTSDYSASVFGKVNDAAASATNWAAYFDGPVKITEKIGIGLAPSDEPEAMLHVKENALFEKTIYTKNSCRNIHNH